MHRIFLSRNTALSSRKIRFLEKKEEEKYINLKKTNINMEIKTWIIKMFIRIFYIRDFIGFFWRAAVPVDLNNCLKEFK